LPPILVILTQKKALDHYSLDASLVGRTVRLTLLAPDIVDAILDGQEPEGLSLKELYGQLPLLWEEQRCVICSGQAS